MRRSTADHTSGWVRIVSEIPLDSLWTPAGPTAHVRSRLLAAADVAQLLARHRDIKLAEARLDMELRWYQRGDYGYWEHHARPHLAEPGNRRSLDEFPDGICYFASEWLEPATGDCVLLFEQHH